MHEEDANTTPRHPLRRWLPRLLPVLGILLFVLAIWTLHAQMQQHKWEDVVAAFRGMPLGTIVLAFALTAAGYITLTGYDLLAMRYIRHALQYRRVALAAFIGYAFSNNIGHSYLTGTTVRFRLYSAWGLTGLDIARVVAFSHVAFYLGTLLLIGEGCLFEPQPVGDELHLPAIAVQVIGAVMLALVVAYLIWTVRRRTPLRVSVVEFPMPSLRLSLAQIAVATADMVLMSSVLYILLPKPCGISMIGFAGVFMIAQVLGLGSQVPGGLGVFETIMLHILTPEAHPPGVLAALVVFRIIYFLIPLMIAVSLMAGYEIRHHQRSWFSRKPTIVP